MTGDDLHECLQTIRWEPRTLAKALGKDDDVVAGWLKGTRPIPAKTAAWIRTLAEAHVALEMDKPGQRGSR